MIDTFHRTINYMRISVTDRCNLRCIYCMPDGVPLIAHEEILRYEEILEVCRAAITLGITNFKITGGEPLVRKGCLSFIKELKNLPGVDSVTITTNGTLLRNALPRLQEIGINAVNVSFDTTDPGEFRYITGYDGCEEVAEAISLCASSGIPTKINSVLLQKENTQQSIQQIKNLAAFARDYKIDVRFIEQMPIGAGVQNGGLTAEEARKILLEEYPDLHRQPYEEKRKSDNGPAKYEISAKLKGRIGWISAVSQRFCGSCNRIRLTSTGQLKPCLCYEESTNLKNILRDKNLDTETRSLFLQKSIEDTVYHKPKEHCFTEIAKISETRKMSQIGG